MAKARKKLTIRIPPYTHPRNMWRVQVHTVIRARQTSSPVIYDKDDKLEVELLLYFNDTQLGFHDVDNRLKDVLDALQGRVGGPKAKRVLPPIVQNDSQIFRVIVQKKLVPPQSRGYGRLTIRRLSKWRVVFKSKTPKRTRGNSNSR